MDKMSLGVNQLSKGGRIMKYALTAMIMVLGLIFTGLTMTGPQAAEIITEDDIKEKVVVEENFVKTADNFIIMFDASNSMKSPYAKDSSMTKYEAAKKLLKEKTALIPDLGYNAGLYLFTPYQPVYPMGAFDKAKFAQAVDSLPAEAKGPTFLPQALRQLDPVLAGLSGKTIVYIFSDGTYSQIEGMKEPEDYTAEYAKKYDVCFYMISSARRPLAQKRLTDMAKANTCSRMIPFSQFLDNPEYITGALYVVKATERIETITDTKIAGVKVNNLQFAFDSAKIGMDYMDEVSAVGSFLQKNPATYVLLEGYTDSVGSEEYNLLLSQRRAESVAKSLMDNHDIAQDRIVVNYYGKANPIASNATSEGRAQNRRVEVAIGGLE